MTTEKKNTQQLTKKDNIRHVVWFFIFSNSGLLKPSLLREGGSAVSFLQARLYFAAESDEFPILTFFFPNTNSPLCCLNTLYLFWLYLCNKLIRRTA